jgi:quinate dehydrogenase
MATQTANGIITANAPNVDHLDSHGYLFGYPIAHSLSPLLHQTIFNGLGLNHDYYLLPSTDIKQFLRLVRNPRCYGKSQCQSFTNKSDLTVAGSGVTMPHKVAILPHLDDMTPECRAVGACNTVFWRDSRLIGTNTDIAGVRESFLQNAPELKYLNRPGLVIGGGGAARSAVYALVKDLGCDTVYLVNRDASEVENVMAWCGAQGYGDGLVHVSSVSQAESLEGPGAIVSCIPNFPPSTQSEWEARRIIECFLQKPHKGAILEMCYHPTVWTEIAEIADRAGWSVIVGTEAMIYQGFEQARCWTGRDYSELPIQEVKDTVARELSKARL